MRKKNWIYVVAILALSKGVLFARAETTPSQRAEIQAHLDKARELMKSSEPLKATDDINAILSLKLDSALTVEALIAQGQLDMKIDGAFGGPGVLDALYDYTKAIEMAAKVTDGGSNFKSVIADAYRFRAEAHSNGGEWKKAVADFDEALKINPRDIESLIGRGEADTHINLGLFSDVKENPEVEPLDDFNAAIKLDPKSARAYVARGKLTQGVLIVQENLQKALPDYEKATQVDPNYAEGWYRHGKVLLLLNDSKLNVQAKSDFDRAIELSPKAEYFSARGTFLSHQTERVYPAIIADFTSAIKYDPSNPKRYTDRADAQSYSPNPDKTQMLADYTAAIKLLKGKQEDSARLAEYGAEDDVADALVDVDMGHALEKRGDLEFESGQYGEALADFNDALKNVPTNNDALAGRGQILIAVGKSKMAIQEISARMAYIRHDTNESTAKKLFAVRGQAFLVTKHYDEALLDLNQAMKAENFAGIQLYSKNADWYFWRALVWANKGDNAHALADLNVAVKLDPAYIEKVKGTEFEKVLSPRDPDKSVSIENGDTALLHKLMGNEWAAADSPANATGEYDKAIALDPNYADAYNNRSLAWMQLKNFESAESDLNKAIALKADDPLFYSNRSTLRLYQQRPADAVADAKKATELDPQNLDFWKVLATAQQLNSSYADAEISLNAALKLAGDDKSEAGALRAKLILIRAVQNLAPSKEELDATFAIADENDLSYLVRACDAEVQRHPEAAAALKNLRDAAAAQIEKLKTG